MLQTDEFPIRTACPPGACVCERALLDAPGADRTILKLTQQEEKTLVARLETISTYAELLGMERKLQERLGIALSIIASANEVRTMRGFTIELAAFPGLCRKTRQSIPAAVRRCLEQHPEIAFAILNANDLFGMASDQR
ncbi:MAG: hypothetical protein QFF03_23580 [Pseudomonadota bacterium]|nr:hypothetical protein [Pseudomonadota bacterium]